MEYPNNFDTPAFPAGRTLAVSRFMGIASMVSFVIIIFLCVLVWWTVRSVRLDPIVIRLNTENGRWSLVERYVPIMEEVISPENAVQNALIANFVTNWFSISGRADQDAALWSECDRDICGKKFTYGQSRCSLYCATTDSVFDNFTKLVVPQYRLRMAAGERWAVIGDSISITSPRVQNGVWQVRAIVQSNINGLFEIMAFVQVGRNAGAYPLTMGYYVQDFNSYRISQ